MSSGGTYRGTVTPGRGQGRGTIPQFNSPSTSGIPRPALEHSQSSATTHSDAGGSSMSASRAKQSKKDEVCLDPSAAEPLNQTVYHHELRVLT